jgi:DNA polymerase-3 subunit gamma/tau
MADRSKMTKPNATPSGYTVLARRYRSRDFDELIGQEPIALTLQNAIKTNRTAHAYLFCGTRGVGKTSMARIFAKALNAADNLKEKDQIADAILRGEDLDVIEIDAASNRGIDNARELIAGSSLSPARCPYKIYIIDEVHMLTREAFNALLKTMEEPPAHVKFILCTTEAHKVPATIQSRCQRFDFRAIPTPKIAQQVKRILNDEGIKADDEVIAQVARLGNGSMRDALSILDRLLAGGEEKLTSELLEEMLGLPDHSLIAGLVDAFIACDAKAALECGAQLLARGTTVEQALELLAEHLRNLMVISACGERAELLDLSDESRAVAARQAAHFDAQGLVHMIAICDSVSRSARTSAAARALFDAALVRLAMSQHFADIAALLTGQAAAPATFGGTEAAAPAALGSSEPKKKEPPASTSAAIARTTRPEVKPPADSELWARVVEVARQSMPDRQRTEHLIFQSYDGDTLRLSLDEGGADVVRYLNQNIDKLVDLVKRATGRNVRVELDTSRLEQHRHGTPAPMANTVLPSAAYPPLVQRALEAFDAEVVSITDSIDAKP